MIFRPGNGSWPSQFSYILRYATNLVNVGYFVSDKSILCSHNLQRDRNLVVLANRIISINSNTSFGMPYDGANINSNSSVSNSTMVFVIRRTILLRREVALRILFDFCFMYFLSFMLDTFCIIYMSTSRRYN